MTSASNDKFGPWAGVEILPATPWGDPGTASLDCDGLLIIGPGKFNRAVKAESILIPTDAEHSPIDILDDFIVDLKRLRSEYIKLETGTR